MMSTEPAIEAVRAGRRSASQEHVDDPAFLADTRDARGVSMKLHPDFPVVEGRFRFTREWELDLPTQFNRRLENGDLVLWRPGLTFWIAAWGPWAGKTAEGRLASILAHASPERTEESVEREGELVRLTYRLQERDPERNPPIYTSISGYVIASSGHVQITAYADDAEATRSGEQVIRSVRRWAGGEQ